MPRVPDMPGSGPRMLDFDKGASQKTGAPSLAVPAAELARQSFLARRAGRAPVAPGAGPAPDVQMPEGGYGPLGAVPQRTTLLGRGEDASTVPARDVAPPKLPVLLGQGPGGVRRPPNYDGADEKEIAEQVRSAFLARQSRIMGRSAARKVP